MSKGLELRPLHVRRAQGARRRAGLFETGRSSIATTIVGRRKDEIFRACAGDGSGAIVKVSSDPRP